MERGMGMEWFIILLIWLVAPFAELAAIIVLSVANSRYKKRIWELTRGTDKADTGMQDKGPADTEIQHERPADAVTQHEKSAAWYGPGQAIVVPEDFEKGETACQVPDPSQVLFLQEVFLIPSEESFILLFTQPETKPFSHLCCGHASPTSLAVSPHTHL